MPTDLFSQLSLPLGQSVQVTNWLTPVWLISVGISVGFLLAVLGLVKILVFQKISALNSIYEKPALRYVVGGLLAVVYAGLMLGFLYWRQGDQLFGEGFLLLLGFLIPSCVLLAFGGLALISKRMVGETWAIFNEGYLKWVNYFCLALLLFAVSGFMLSLVNGFGILKPVDDPVALMRSLARLPATGKFERTYQIPADHDETGFPIEANFLGQELQWMTFETDRPVELAAAELGINFNPLYLIEVPVSEEPLRYNQRSDGRGSIPFVTDAETGEPLTIDYLYVNNPSSQEATLTLTWVLAPIYQEVSIIPWSAFWTLLMYWGYLSLATLFPKTYAVALSTFKTEISQPLYLLVLGIGVVFMVASIYIPYNTFGEDIKMYKDSGLTLIRVLAIFLAIWAASKSVAEEIEGRTALTVLSKPVSRRQFILGKFSGISLAIALLFIVLGFWFVSWVAYKPIYDYKEAAKGVAEWAVCYEEATHVIPGVFLCFLEVVVFVFVSVAISTRLGTMANFLICFAIYVLGHLTPLLVQSAFGEIETIEVFAKLIAVIFPVLNHYDVHAAINTNEPVPLVYQGWMVIYTMLYGTIALLFSLVLFEDRDLA